MAQSVKVGDKAPNFALFSQDGVAVELNDFVGKKPIVIFFYPKDDTLVCTKEACHFRDNFNEFNKLNNADVIGISSDSVESHKDFSEKNNLPFILLNVKFFPALIAGLSISKNVIADITTTTKDTIGRNRAYSLNVKLDISVGDQ